MRNSCSSSPWCDEDKCKCDEWAEEEAKIEKAKKDASFGSQEELES